jgi:hypothetical protein
VAGFNQFFDDAEGTRAWNYGVAVDRKFSPKAYAGMEYVWRNLEVPYPSTFFPPPPAAPVTTIKNGDWREQQGRAYLYWTPDDRIALSGNGTRRSMKIGSSPRLRGGENHRYRSGPPSSIPAGSFARLNGTWYHQKELNLQGTPSDVFVPGSDSFWVVNPSIGYRLPGRHGILSLEVRNLFDEAFRYEDTDPASPVLQPERAVFLKVTIAL